MLKNLTTLIEGMAFVLGVSLLSNALLTGASFELIVWILYGMVSLLVISANIQTRKLKESAYNLVFKTVVEVFFSAIALLVTSYGVSLVLAAICAFVIVLCLVLIVLMTLFRLVK